MRNTPRRFYSSRFMRHGSVNYTRPAESRFNPPRAHRGRHPWFVFLLASISLLCVVTGARADKRILLIAGKVSHGPGDHEFRAGTLILQRCLSTVPGVQALVASNGWPTDESVFKNVDAVLIYAD